MNFLMFLVYSVRGIWSLLVYLTKIDTFSRILLERGVKKTTLLLIGARRVKRFVKSVMT